MTAIADEAVSLPAEQREFVPSRTYFARHACGVSIIALGRDLHDAIVAHTAACPLNEGNHRS